MADPNPAVARTARMGGKAVVENNAPSGHTLSYSQFMWLKRQLPGAHINASTTVQQVGFALGVQYALERLEKEFVR